MAKFHKKIQKIQLGDFLVCEVLSQSPLWRFFMGTIFKTSPF
jgi:hypothetical protein